MNTLPYRARVRKGNLVNFSLLTGRKIAPNTGANATKFFTLVTKS